GPGAMTAPNGHQMLVTAGKEGRIYLIDAGNMGGFNTQYVIDGREIDSTTNSAVDPAPYDRVLGEYYYRQANGNPGIFANGLTNGIIWNNDVNHSGTVGTLSTAISSGQVVTSLSVSPLQIALSSGNTITLIAANGSRQQVTASANASAGATSITVTSFTANAAYATGTFINGPNQPGDYLVAYDTAGNMLFSSNWTINGAANSISNSLTNGVAGATGVKFSIPTIANGNVYVGTGAGSGTGGSAHVLGTIVGFGQ